MSKTKSCWIGKNLLIKKFFVYKNDGNGGYVDGNVRNEGITTMCVKNIDTIIFGMFSYKQRIGYRLAQSSTHIEN